MKVFSLIIVILALSGCGSYSTVTQTQEATYIELSGETKGLSMIIDKGATVDLEKADSFDRNGKRITRFDIAPGSHVLMIKRGNTVEIHQNIYVSEGNAVEVRLQ